MGGGNPELIVRTGVEGQAETLGFFKQLQDAANKLKEGFKSIAGADISTPMMQLGESFRAGSQAASGMGGMVQLLSGSMEALLSPVGLVGAGVGALIAIMNKAASATEAVYREMRSLTAVTGMSVEETNVLADAFKLMGFEGDMMTRTMFRLSMEIENGGKKLGVYGVAIRDIDGNMRSTGEVFEDTLKKLGEISNASARNAALMQLFGRAGRELAPMLEQGAAGLEKFKEKARDVGIMTKEDMDRTKELIQAKAALSDAFEDMWIVLGRSLIPALSESVKVLNFFIEGVTAIIGLTIEWIKWMVTSNEAMDPISVSLKVIAGSFVVIARSIRVIVESGKALADFLAPPPGAEGKWEALARHMRNIKKIATGSDEPLEERPGGGGPKTGTKPGSIITPDDINERAKSRDAQLKIDQKYFSDLKFFETGSKSEQLKMQMGYNELIIQAEREKTAELLKITTDPIKIEKIKRDLNEKEIAAAGDRRLALLQIRQAEADDAKKTMDDQVKARRDASEQEIKIIEMQRDSESRLIERVDTDAKTKIEDRKNLEIDSTRQITEAKKGAIDSEIAANKALALQYQDNAVLQQDVQRKLMDLANQRANVELDQISRVAKARDDAAKAEQDRRDKEAGMLGQLIKMAEEYAKSQGRKTITTGDIGMAQQQQQKTSGEQFAQFFGGGAVDPAKMRQAMEFQQFQRQMQQQGSTPESVLSASFGQAQKTTPGLGYDAATAAYNRGDIGMGDIMYKQAQGQAEIERAGGGIPADKFGIGNIKSGIKDAGDKAIADMIGQIPPIMGDWFTKFSDGLIRKLEEEASRI